MKGIYVGNSLESSGFNLAAQAMHTFIGWHNMKMYVTISAPDKGLHPDVIQFTQVSVCQHELHCLGRVSRDAHKDV